MHIDPCTPWIQDFYTHIALSFLSNDASSFAQQARRIVSSCSSISFVLSSSALADHATGSGSFRHESYNFICTLLHSNIVSVFSSFDLASLLVYPFSSGVVR